MRSPRSGGSCWHRPERVFGHGRPGYCPQCKEYVAGALDRHMMNNHLVLGQLWRCPVEWCAVWKGSVGDYLDHLRGKHDGSQFLALKNLGQIFLSWTVPRDFVDIKLFHESGCQLVHKYTSDHSIVRIVLGAGAFGMLPDCSALPGVCCISSSFVCPRCCSHQVLAALDFSGRGAGVSNSTDGKGHRATRPESYTVCPVGRNPWMTQTGSRLLGFHLFLLHRALFQLSGRAIFRSRLAPHHSLIYHLRFPDGTPGAPGSRPRCAGIIFDAFSDWLCAFRGFCGVHVFVFFGGVRRFGWG